MKKAIEIDGNIEVYPNLPKKWKRPDGKMSYNYRARSSTDHKNDGWKDLITPEKTSSQVYGDIILNTDKDRYEYEVIDILTPEYNPSTERLGERYYDEEEGHYTFPVEAIPEEEIKQRAKSESEGRRMEIQERISLQKAQEEAANYDDETALENQDIYPMWEVDVEYKEGDKRLYFVDNTLVLFKCIDNHTSQETWTPTNAPSLWAEVLYNGETAQWKQPDSTNGYMTDDTVFHNGKKWKSLVDDNVWEPIEQNSNLWEEVGDE